MPPQFVHQFQAIHARQIQVHQGHGKARPDRRHQFQRMFGVAREIQTLAMRQHRFRLG